MKTTVIERNRIWIFIAVLSVATAIWLHWAGEIIKLRAVEQLDVVDGVNGGSIAKLSAGDALPVTGCESTKSDVVVRVRLQSGAEGLVLLGSYRLERRPISVRSLVALNEPVFSCKGILIPISDVFER